MLWHLVTDTETGEQSYACCDSRKTLGGYDGDRYRVEKLAAKPTQFHKVRGGKPVLDKELEARVREESRLNSMSAAQRQEEAISRAEDRLARRLAKAGIALPPVPG